MNALLLVLLSCASAQLTWQEMNGSETAAPARELAVELSRDKPRLGERAGRVLLTGGTTLRRKGPGESWSYLVNYGGLEAEHVDDYLGVAELRGIISPDRDRAIRSELTARLMPEAESVAARIAFLDSARSQVQEDLARLFAGRGPVQDRKTLELDAALRRLEYERQQAARSCRRLASNAELGRALSCPR